MEIVPIFPASQQEDLYAVSLYLCTELLKDESSKFDLAGPVLPLIKTLSDRTYAARQATGQVFQRVMNGVLSACIGHVEEMRFVRNFRMPWCFFLLVFSFSWHTDFESFHLVAVSCVFLLVLALDDGGDKKRGRAGPAATTKVRNNLLTLTLLLTTLPADIRISRAVIERTCDIVGQRLTDSDDVSRIKKNPFWTFETNYPLGGSCALKTMTIP